MKEGLFTVLFTLSTIFFCQEIPEITSLTDNTNNVSSFNYEATHYQTKFDAVISVLEYGDSNPITILYKVYPYGGSGNYTFRWRLYGNTFQGNGTDTFEPSFTCLPQGEEQICKVYCEVTDTNTNEKFVAELRHPVIPCY